jgi:hypothetical protein
MIRFLFRFAGLWVLAAGFLALVYDGAVSIAAGDLRLSKTGELWRYVHFSSLQQIQPALERHVHPFLWDPVMVTILLAPPFVVLGVIGSILVLIGHKRERRWAMEPR